MKIGIDISIVECRRNGYPVIEFKKRELIKNGILQKDCYVNVTISNPEEWYDNGKVKFNGEFNHFMTDCNVTWNDVLEQYNDDKKSIDSFAETEKNIDFQNPNEYDLLHLISDVSNYKGIY